ncbi:MAG: PIG-L family deacetylase [Planctomycetes bacterium]|nr:PIG-L family deacetylase [Planctomycetota bacterium]
MPMATQPPRLLILGAHPDDAEFHAGALATIYRRHGHVVKMVSVTDGRSGHHRHAPEQLARIRLEEGRKAAAVIGAEYEAWDHPDGTLLPTLDVRSQIIREIRAFRPDLVLTHRPYDYHPDHRAVGQAVQDASYLVTVPLVEPDVPILSRDPVVGYMVDLFTRPYPLVGDVVIDIADTMDTIVDMLACHKSQVFEFLPFNKGVADQVPAEERHRREWLRQWYTAWIRPRAERFREQLVRQYGEPHGRRVECIEAYEISEYASPLDEAARRRLFWFL